MATKLVRRVASRSLKKKSLVHSTQAAAISLAVHLAIVVFAGSFVAIEYIRKNSEFEATKIDRPKLERRQLVMPTKTQELQQQSTRPKVTTRMAAINESSFKLPDMSGLDNLDTTFDRDAEISDRSLSNMGAAGSLGFGISGINFFGARSKGEKMVFVMSTEEKMMTDDKGGFYTYQFAKDRIIEMINGMRSATLFNMMVYNKNQTAMFRDKLVPATPENKAAVKEWLAPVNKTDDVVEKIGNMKVQYKEVRQYEDSPLYFDGKSEIQHFVRPIQAAMEQKADNIFVLTGGYGTHHVSTEVVMKRHNIQSEQEWLTAKGWPPERVAENEKEQEELIKKARKRLAEENAAREADGKPKKFISDIWEYIHEELNWTFDRPPSIRDYFMKYGYPPEDLIEHLEAVYRYNYIPQQLDRPKIHMVKVISSDGSPVDWPGGERQTFEFNSLKKIPKAFGGRFDLLRGAKTMEDLLRYNDVEEQ